MASRPNPLLMSLLLAIAALPAAAQRCAAVSGSHVAQVVELYTSEGCNSCPPADRWLSTLKAKPGVLAAAFHVDYWDRLGWEDRFASARYTDRQAMTQAFSGARFNYTPQVLVDGRDWRRWPALPEATSRAAAVRIDLQREGDTVQARITLLTPHAGGPARLGLWWALLEDSHASVVKAGENAGATLQHDHVVRQYGVLPAWAGDAPSSWSIKAGVAAEGGRAARLLVVVTDPATGQTVQAVQLTC